jgi:hypothetical protein
MIAPEFHVNEWFDKNGNKTEAIKLSDFDGKFKVLFCFQSWCRGCHSKGFPDLKKMIEAANGNVNVVFLAIQTVFEGHHENTFDKMLEIQKLYDLKIPFGNDAGDDGKSISKIFWNYNIGGTPWFIFIDKNNKVVYSDFRFNEEIAIKFLKSVE